jgi:rubrerythrin
MQTSSRLLAFVALGGVIALASCGGSPEISPVAATTTASGDDAVFTSSGFGPGQPSPTPGAGTCTDDCDGTSQGPGPGTGNGHGPGPGNGYGPGGGFCGDACTGPVGPDPNDISTVLGEALQEEYKARYLYESVLGDYPGAMPFAAIAESEMRHVEALQLLFTRRQMTPPAWAPEPFPAFASIHEACAAGIAAEIADAAFYDKYLPRTDLPQDVRNVFTNLQAASLENHLPAFERCR